MGTQTTRYEEKNIINIVQINFDKQIKALNTNKLLLQ